MFRAIFSSAAVFSVSLGLGISAYGEINSKNFDTSAKPEADFFQYVNGGWIKANPIPADRPSWGMFNELDERNKAGLKTILETAAAGKPSNKIERMVGDFYASGMDEAAIEKDGIKPLKPELSRIDSIRSVDGIQTAVARLHRMGVGAGFAFTSEPDPKNSTMVIGTGVQSGLGLPERDYYFRDDDKSKQLRERYVEHVARMLELAGDKAADAKTKAATVMKLETALAKVSKKVVDLRDPVANYHKMTVAELQKLTPHFQWDRYFKDLDLAHPGDIDVEQPEFFQGFNAALTEIPLDDWKVYLRWQLIHDAAPYLSSGFVNENFEFYGKTLTGAEKLKDRWKRVLETVDGGVGEALGQLYVAKYFPPESKVRMLNLVENLRAALRDRLATLEWMDDPTRAKAAEKLNAFAVKIGYPDKWIDYGKVKIDRGSYVRNVMRASEFNYRRKLDKIGKPVDRTEWEMTPPTVNAYYNPSLNEIVFPAGILQPPFFDAKADDAVNYGGIGAVIGHEMTHGFDDQGRQYDAQGNLTDWWSPESATRFKERSGSIVKQFDHYVAIDDLHVNGELTQGENIADLGGVKIAYAALKKAMAGKPAEKIDGFTPDQRFFLNWAVVWAWKSRPEALRLLIRTNPHSPPRFRVNGPLSNLDEFANAFSIPEGAAMRAPADARVTIW